MKTASWATFHHSLYIYYLSPMAGQSWKAKLIWREKKEEFTVSPKRMRASKLVNYSHLHGEVMKQIIAVPFALHSALGRVSGTCPPQKVAKDFSQRTCYQKPIVSEHVFGKSNEPVCQQKCIASRVCQGELSDVLLIGLYRFTHLWLSALFLGISPGNWEYYAG